MKPITVFFMCEPGRLEWQSICLAASLRAFCLDDYDLIAYCSEHKADCLQKDTVYFLRGMNVTLSIINTLDIFGKINNHGNKIIASSQPKESEFSIFLDSDTVAVNNFRFYDHCWPGHVCLLPSPMHPIVLTIDQWQYLYGKFGLNVPLQRVRTVLKGQNLVHLPYFNAGVIAYPENGYDFGSKWLTVAQKIDTDSNFPPQRQFLDQTALPVAIKLSGLNFGVLDRKMNFPLGQQAKVGGVSPTILHYHYGMHLLNYDYIEMIDNIILEMTGVKGLSALIGLYNNVGLTDKMK